MAGDRPRQPAYEKTKKFTKTPYFGGSRSFKVIDVDIAKKLVASACYVRQNVICGDPLHSVA